MAKIEKEKLEKVNGGVWQNTLRTENIPLKAGNGALLPATHGTSDARVGLPSLKKDNAYQSEDYIFVKKLQGVYDPNALNVPFDQVPRPASVSELEDTDAAKFVK